MFRAGHEPLHTLCKFLYPRLRSFEDDNVPLQGTLQGLTEITHETHLEYLEHAWLLVMIQPTWLTAPLAGVFQWHGPAAWW